MGLPGNLSVITVTGKYTNPDGSDANGSVSFTPTTAVLDNNAQVIIPASPIVISLSNGTFSTVLPCTDSIGLRPTVWAWNIVVAVNGVDGPQSAFTCYLPSTLGGVVDISQLVPVPGVSPGPISLLNSVNTWTGTNTFLGTYPTAVVLPGGYLPLPAGTPPVGSVPVVSASSPLSLVWGVGGGGGGGTAIALATTTSGVVVNTATAPAAGQVLTAQSGTNATWVTPAGTVAYALTSGTAFWAGTASYSLTSGTAAYSLTSGTAAYSLTSGTAFYATNAGTAFWAGTASYSLTSGTAAYTPSAGTAFWAGTAFYALSSGTAFYSNSAGTVFAISALTTLGDILYENSTPAPARLAGNTTAVKKFLTQTGTGAVSAAPAWGTITAADLPTASTSAQGAVILDGTASDIQPSPATRAAGAVGQVADAGHVHGQPPMFAPTGLTGATAASRYVGATVSGAPTTGTFAVGDFVVDQNAQIWVCTTAGSPGTWTREGAQAYQFFPESYGGIADGRMLTDGSVSTGGTTLTCATSTPFLPGDVGKYVLIWGANTSTTYLFSRITSYASSSQVGLANSTGNGTASVGVVYGTDNTSAIQQAVNAAVTRSLLGNGSSATVVFQDGIYCVASPAVQGGATFGDAQITLPNVYAPNGIKSQLTLTGTGPAAFDHWLQPNPPQYGTILLGMRTDGSLSTTIGPTSVIGGPITGFGGGGGSFSNMCLTVSGITIMVPSSSTPYCGLDLYGIGQASIKSFSYLPLEVVPVSSTWPSFTTLGKTNVPTYSFGLRMPAIGNNAISDIGEYSCYFAQVGLIGSEHNNWKSLKTLYCAFGLLAQTNTGGNSSHGMSGLYWTCEECTYAIGSSNSGYYVLDTPIAVNVEKLSLETYTHVVNDLSGNMRGTLVFDDLSLSNAYFNNLYANSNMGVKLINANAVTGPLASPQPTVATGGTWNNYYYRDAQITFNPAPGTITGLTIGTVAQYITSGTNPVTFMLPSGLGYTPTYSGTFATHGVTVF